METNCNLIVMVGYKAVYVCQNSLNCTLKMDAFYLMKLYLDEVGFLKKERHCLCSYGASVGRRCNSSNSGYAHSHELWSVS